MSVMPINNGSDESEVDDFIMPALPEDHIKTSGYETMGIVTLPASDNFDYTKLTYEPRQPFLKSDHIDENEARQALAQFVSEHCCYGSKPVQELVFKNLSSSETFRYELQTFTESRTTAYANEPYDGRPFIINGNPPGPWQVMCSPGQMFNDEVRHIEIPNTTNIQMCNRCRGSCQVRCHSCRGTGSKRCFSCHGNGVGVIGEDNHPCHNCYGSGRAMCHKCGGDGHRRCFTCNGFGQLRWFIRLTVSYHNYRNDFLKDSKPDNISDELIRMAVAQSVFSEQNLRVQPVTNYPDQDINRASANLIGSHNSQYSNIKILGQRHDITVIPITHCMFEWKGELGDYHVYGLDQKVFAPNYPKKCCCTIL